MKGRYVRREDADRLSAELWQRVRERSRSELGPLAEQWGALPAEEFQRRWDAAVDRILDEELAAALERLRAASAYKA